MHNNKVMTYISRFTDLTNICLFSGLALLLRNYKNQNCETWYIYTSGGGKLNASIIIGSWPIFHASPI